MPPKKARAKPSKNKRPSGERAESEEGGGADDNDDGTQVETSAKRGKKNKSSNGATKRKPRNQTATDGPLYKSAFKEFVLNACKIGIPGLLAEFDDIKKQTQAIGTTPKIAFDTNPDKNRYKDVFCVDNGRVVLNGGASDYIHANWVDVMPDKRQYICTQGPIAATIDDFWRMVWQEKCKSIVMLCNIVECGKKKCEQYWPEAAGQEATYGSLKVTATEKGEFEKLMTVTKLTMTDGPDTHELEHIIWNNWPDRGVPSDTLTCFKLLDKLKKLSPTVIHCSAGIGRTGTIVGLDLILSRLRAGEVKTAKEIVIELRSRRHGSVQMDIQYLYIHRVLIAFGMSRKLCSESSGRPSGPSSGPGRDSLQLPFSGGPGRGGTPAKKIIPDTRTTSNTTTVLKESDVKPFIDAYEALCKQRGFL